jgi:hypothetical protein
MMRGLLSIEDRRVLLGMRNLDTMKQIVAIVAVAFLAASNVPAQQNVTSGSGSTEEISAKVFEIVLRQDWRPMKQLVRPNLQQLCTTDKFTDPNKTEWGMGFEDWDRITYGNESELTTKFRGLVFDWKSGRRRKGLSFYKDRFPDVHRFAVESCGTADGTATIVIAVYMSNWDARKQSLALLFGR